MANTLVLLPFTSPNKPVGTSPRPSAPAAVRQEIPTADFSPQDLLLAALALLQNLARNTHNNDVMRLAIYGAVDQLAAIGVSREKAREVIGDVVSRLPGSNMPSDFF